MARAHRLRRHSDRAVEAASSAADNGTVIGVPAVPASDEPNILFGFKPVETLPKRRRAPGLPKLPKALAEAAEVYVGLGANSKFSQLPVLPTTSRTSHLDPLSALLRVPGDSRSTGLGLAEHIDIHHRLGTPSDHGEDENGISMDWTPLLSRHHARRAAQHTTWLNVVIPSLVYPFLEYTHGASSPVSEAFCTCASRRSQDVILAHWDVLSQTTLKICDCNTAALQLVRRGFFPCAPKRPSLAFSLPLLEFISLHSLNVAPNSSAWADTLQLFWQRRKYMPMTAESLRKRLGNALHWYQVLINRKDAHVQALIADATRQRRQPAKRSAPSPVHSVEPHGKRQRIDKEDGYERDAYPQDMSEGSECPRAPRKNSDFNANTCRARVEDDVEDAQDVAPDARGTSKTSDPNANSRRARIGNDVDYRQGDAGVSRDAGKNSDLNAHSHRVRFEDDVYAPQRDAGHSRDAFKNSDSNANFRRTRIEDGMEGAQDAGGDARETPKTSDCNANPRRARVEDDVDNAEDAGGGARDALEHSDLNANPRLKRIWDDVDALQADAGGSGDVSNTSDCNANPRRALVEDDVEDAHDGARDARDTPKNSDRNANSRRTRIEDDVGDMLRDAGGSRDAPKNFNKNSRRARVEDDVDNADDAGGGARDALEMSDAPASSRRSRFEDDVDNVQADAGGSRDVPKTSDTNTNPRRTRVEDDVEGARDAARETQDTSKRDVPSEILRRRCPLCFGGPRPALKHTDAHVLVCLDANFAQKRRKSAVSDPGLEYLGTRFLSREEVLAMEVEVEGKRKGGRSARTSGLSDDVLDECEKSFIAAQEGITKASKNYYSDTGLMAILCRHDRVLWVANMTSAGEKQYYVLALLDRVMRDLPLDWRVGVLYDIACQLSRSIERFRYLEQYAPRLSFAVSVFHAYGHQWSCQIVYHPRKRNGFGLTDGEGCERFWSAIRRLIAVLRVCGFFRRLFMLDRQFDFIDQEGMKKSGKWLARRWRDCMKRLYSAEETLRGVRCDEDTLAKEWEAQVRSQLVKPTRQSKSAGAKAIDSILLDIGRAAEVAELVKHSEAKLRKTATRMRPSDLQALTDTIDTGKREVKAIRSRIKTAAAALGTESARQLRAMRGDDYVCARVNARALRANIREAVRAHKFERERLERAYRRQVMQHKDHAQTRDLVHRKQKTITSMVNRYNALVKKMEVLVKQGRVPTRRTRAPRRLDTKELFKLDVDDEIWQEDPGLGPQDEGNLPRWQVDSEVRRGIPAMLEARRCREELERLDAEARSLVHWWTEERKSLESVQLEGVYGAELQARAETLNALGWMWTRDLASAGFSVSFEGSSQFTAGLAMPPIPTRPAPKGDALPDSGAKSDSDDDSRILSDEEEDEPAADHLDDVADADADTDADDEPSEGSGSSLSDEEALMGDQGFEESAGASKARNTHGDAARRNTGATRPDNARGAAGAPIAKSRPRRAFSPSAKSIGSSSDSNGDSDGTGEGGRCCGPYSCTASEVLLFVRRTEWVSGDGIAVLSESFVRDVNRKRAGVVPSTVFRDLKEHWGALQAGELATADKIKTSISRQLRIARLPQPSEATKWLIVVHIELPKHWVLVELRWRAKVVRFYDSFSLKDGYADTVKNDAFRFLELCGDLYGEPYNKADWTWVGEERPLRQTNGYDCGPFAVADLESLLTSDSPSTKTQADMRAWRAQLAQRLRALPRDSRDKASIRVASSLALARGVEVFDVDEAS